MHVYLLFAVTFRTGGPIAKPPGWLLRDCYAHIADRLAVLTPSQQPTLITSDSVFKRSVCPRVYQVRTAVSKTLVTLFENDVLGALLEDALAQKDAYNRSVRCRRDICWQGVNYGARGHNLKLMSYYFCPNLLLPLCHS